MAPVCTACRLTPLLLVMLFALPDLKDANSLRVYDRQTLLAIRSSYSKFFYCNYGNQRSFSPPFLPGVPVSVCLCCASALPQLRRRRRRHGKGSGLLVRMKAAFTHIGKELHLTATGFNHVNYEPRKGLTYTCLTPVVGIIKTTPRL